MAKRDPSRRNPPACCLSRSDDVREDFLRYLGMYTDIIRLTSKARLCIFSCSSQKEW